MFILLDFYNFYNLYFKQTWTKYISHIHKTAPLKTQYDIIWNSLVVKHFCLISNCHYFKKTRRKVINDILGNESNVTYDLNHFGVMELYFCSALLLFTTLDAFRKHEAWTGRQHWPDLLDLLRIQGQSIHQLFKNIYSYYIHNAYWCIPIAFIFSLQSYPLDRWFYIGISVSPWCRWNKHVFLIHKCTGL